MADRKISEFDLATEFTVDMYIPIVDPNEILEEDRNKRFTLAQLFGAVTSSSATTLTLSASTVIVTMFNGSSEATWTLPETSADIVGIPVYVINIGTAFLNIEGDGSDTIQGSDPYSIPNGDTKKYEFTWNGSSWSVR